MYVSRSFINACMFLENKYNNLKNSETQYYNK